MISHNTSYPTHILIYPMCACFALLPASTAGVNISLVLCAFFWLFANPKETVPVEVTFWIGLLVLSTLCAYNWQTPWRSLLRLSHWLSVPLFIGYLRYQPVRSWAYTFFLGGTLLGCILGCWKWYWQITGKYSGPQVLQDAINTGIYTSFAVFLALQKIIERPSLPYALLALFGSYYIYYPSSCRSSQLLLALLILLTFYQQYGLRKHICSGLALVGLTLGLAWYQSDNFQDRWYEFVHHTQEYHHARTVKNTNPEAWHTYRSKGLPPCAQRLEYIYNSWLLIQKAPLFGHGLGNFQRAYQTYLPAYPITANPHSQWLLVLVEQGILGLAMLWYCLWRLYRLNVFLPRLERNLYQGLAMMVFVVGSFNSFLRDFGTTHLVYFFLAWILAALPYEHWRHRYNL